MHLAETPEQEALRDELREYFAELLPREVRDGMGDTARAAPSSAASCARWVPTAGSGSAGRRSTAARVGPPTDQFIFFDEVQRAQAPFPFVTVNTVGPTLMALRHRRAEGAASCRASSPARSTSRSATPSPRPAPTSRRCAPAPCVDGDEWVINGNKIFTSGANQADYVWLACRTDPDAPKHKGISIIIVPTDVARLLVDADRHRRRQRHDRHLLQDVRVPVDNVVGEVNGGWRLITTQLNHERVGLAALSGLDPSAATTTSSSGPRTDRRAGPTGSG